MTNFESFDIEKYLQDRHVHYLTEGKNISDGWIGTRCIFPGCSDQSDHLGINLTSKTFSCWVCGKSGNLISLIMQIDNCSMAKAFKTVDKFSYAQTSTVKRSSNTAHYRAQKIDFKLSIECENRLFDEHSNYLTKRNFDAQYIFDKYKLQCVGPLGKYKHRLIIPYYYKNQLLTFSGRDITGKSNEPYLHCPDKSSPENPKTMLYNLDSVSDTIVFVEGTFDVFRTGDGFVATSGTKFTLPQIYLCYMTKSIKRVFVLFDPEEQAQKQAELFGSALSCVMNNVEVIVFGDVDPGELAEDDVKVLRKELFGRIY